MAVFKITKEKAIQSNRGDFFRNELDLRDFFAANLVELLGVRFLNKEHRIPEGRIDTLGIDEDNSPVIIEYKWDEDDRILTQGQFYYSWLLENRSHFELLVADRLGKDIKVNWDRPRVILVAQGFGRYIRGAAKHIDYVELVTYSYYEPDVLHLEGVESISTKIISSIDNESGDVKVFDWNFHRTIVNSEEVRTKMDSLRGKVLNLPEVEELLGQQTGVTYKSTRKFARFEFKSTFVQILLKNPSYSKDTQKLVEDITTHGWGYSGKIKFNKESDVDYVFEIIKEAYEQTQ